MFTKKLLFSLIGLCLATNSSLAQSNYWGADNGDGTYTNPIIHGDYPDPDIIRVGSDYYMVSSSFVAMPGIPISHSKDLLHWEIIGHAYDKLTLRPEFSMTNEQTAYAAVSWAPTIKYHKGTFYIGVNSPNVGFIMFKSTKPDGPYSMHVYGKNMQDPGFFVDDDDQMYITHGIGEIFLTSCNDDGTGLKEGQVDQSIITPPEELKWIFEGCHMYKRDGYYYVFNTCHGYNGKQTVSRSRNLTGPYETRVILDDAINYPDAGVHQGGMVDTEEGEWWGFTFQDRDYMGRDLLYYPMRWVDGWPVFGTEGRETKGVVTHRKPNIKADISFKTPQQSDDFSADKLKLVWNFNHVPLDSHWSLIERPGFLRIHSKAASSWSKARNTLTQKVAGPAGSATTKVDFTQLKEGDLGGLMIFGEPYSLLGILKEKGKNMLQMRLQEEGKEVVKDSVEIPTNELYLRVNLTKEGTVYYSYSFNNEVYTKLGEESAPHFWGFLGVRYGLFCYNTSQAVDSDCGSIDFDDFKMTCTRNGNHYDAREWVDFSQYDDQRGTTRVRPVYHRPMVHMAKMKQGAWIQFNNLVGLPESKMMSLRYKSPLQAGSILELRKGSVDGELILSCDMPMGGNANNWCEKNYVIPADLEKSKLYFVLRGNTEGVELKGFKFQ